MDGSYRQNPDWERVRADRPFEREDPDQYKGPDLDSDHDLGHILDTDRVRNWTEFVLEVMDLDTGLSAAIASTTAFTGASYWASYWAS